MSRVAPRPDAPRCAACRRRLRRPTPTGLGPVCERRLNPATPRASPAAIDGPVPMVPGQTELPLADPDLWSL
jgi:hypothetical protein